MSDSLDLLIFGAHPDDAEIGMGGTIYKHTSKGCKVGICDLTYAEMSSNGTVETRQEEASLASRVLKLTMRSNLGLPDRKLSGDEGQVEKITLEIRKYQPKVVFAPYYRDRHPDHVQCHKLIKEAVFNSKLKNYLPHTKAWNVKELYFYCINDIVQPDLLVDISDIYEQKRAALQAYRSQFERSLPGTVDTPLNQGYLQNVEARDKVWGQSGGFQYAEGFVTDKPYPVNLFV